MHAGLIGSRLVWFGLVWFGLVWFGLVWFGLVWFGFFGLATPCGLHTWPADPGVGDAGDAEVVHDVTHPLQLDLCRSKVKIS
jgi:hypothetical protein